MKKNFCFSSLALLLGCVSSGAAFGQYPGAYGSLAPSAYPVQYPQPQMQQPTARPQYPAAQYPAAQMQPQFQQFQAGAQLNAPQVPANYSMTPARPVVFNAQAPVSKGWVGPVNGQYQLAAAQGQAEAVPVPMPQAQHVAPQAFPQQPHGAQSHSVLEHGGQPMMNQAAPSTVYHDGAAAAPVYDQGYAQSVAPTCTSCGTAPISQSYGYPAAGGYPVVGSDFGYGNQLVGGAPFGRMSGFAGSMFTGMPIGAKPYFGGAGVLLFNRVDDANRVLSYDVAMPTANVLGTRDARMGVTGGFEVFLGRYFNCGRNAISASYWGLFPETETVTVTGTDLRARVPFAGPGTSIVNMPATGIYPQESVYQWYDDVRAQRLVRSSDIHNVEANLLGFAAGGAARSFYLPTGGSMFGRGHGGHGGFGGHGGGCGYCGGSGCNACYSDCGSCEPTRFATGPCCLTPGCGSRLNLTWLAGVRYFRFEDDLRFSASRLDNAFNGPDDIHYDVNVTNDLVGFQLGSMMNYCLGKRFNVFGVSKMGVYGNHSEFTSRLGTNDTLAYVTSNNQFNGQGYMVSSSKSDVAFIGELGTGLNVRLTSKWSGNVGYRGIVASGVATAPSQIPYDMTHLGNVADFNNNSTLILHGITLGGMYNF